MLHFEYLHFWALIQRPEFTQKAISYLLSLADLLPSYQHERLKLIILIFVPPVYESFCSLLCYEDAPLSKFSCMSQQFLLPFSLLLHVNAKVNIYKYCRICHLLMFVFHNFISTLWSMSFELFTSWVADDY